MSNLVVIAFPTEAKAEEVRQKLFAMQKEYLIELDDAVVAAKDAQGRIKLNQLINTTTAARFPAPSGAPDRPDLPDAAGWRRDGRRLRRPRRGFDGSRHQRQMDERNGGRHSAGDSGVIRARAQGHGGQGS